MIEFHQKLLGDSVRNKAFYEALKRSIKKGQTIVSDIGSGTGFLAFLASKLGAKECYLYETSPDLLALSKKIAAENNIKNCKFFAAHSSEIKNPVKTDLVVSETLGNYALEENIIETLRDAKRFLKPDGIIIPQKLRQYAAPVTYPRVFNEINVWDGVGFDINLEAAAQCALNNMYVYRVRPEEMPKNSAQEWDNIDFLAQEKSVRSSEILWNFDAPAAIYGFCLWWECELVPGVSLSTSPFEAPTHWNQIFLPILQKMEIQKGDKLKLKLISDSRYEVGIRLQWQVEHINPRNKILQAVRMDTEKGLL